MNKSIRTSLKAVSVSVPILGGMAALGQTFLQLDLFLRVGLMLAGTTAGLLVASHFLANWCARKTGYPNEQQKAAQRRKAWRCRSAIVLASIVLVLVVRVVFDLSAIQVWQPKDAAGDKLIVYASLTKAGRVDVSLPRDADCLVGDLAGRASADWIPKGPGTDKPGIIIRNFSFPEAVAASCGSGTMTRIAIANATPPMPIEPLSGAEASKWHSIFLIWGVLTCALGLVWLQFWSRLSV